MRHLWLVLSAILFLLAACAAPAPATPVVVTVEVVVAVTATPLPPTATPTPAPTRPPLPTPTPFGVPAISNFPYRIIAYYPSWAVYARKYLPVDVPVQHLTHIN